ARERDRAPDYGDRHSGIKRQKDDRDTGEVVVGAHGGDRQCDPNNRDERGQSRANPNHRRSLRTVSARALLLLPLNPPSGPAFGNVTWSGRSESCKGLQLEWSRV